MGARRGPRRRPAARRWRSTRSIGAGYAARAHREARAGLRPPAGLRPSSCSADRGGARGPARRSTTGPRDLVAVATAAQRIGRGLPAPGEDPSILLAGQERLGTGDSPPSLKGVPTRSRATGRHFTSPRRARSDPAGHARRSSSHPGVSRGGPGG
jgi:hypothetical protein